MENPDITGILKRAKKKVKKIKQAQEELPMEDQITINLNNQPKKLKKYKTHYQEWDKW